MPLLAQDHGTDLQPPLVAHVLEKIHGRSAPSELDAPRLREAVLAGIQVLLDDPRFGPFLILPTDRAAVLAIYAELPLTESAAGKLLELRDALPDVFVHSLQVSLCALALRFYGQPVSVAEMGDAAAAGLFHDVGLLHIDSRLLIERQPLSEREQHHIYAHPVLGHLVLRECAGWPGEVERAVLEHHERLDGSGYPLGLLRDDISPLARVLALAELAASVLSRPRVVPMVLHVHVILGLNQGKFDPALTQVLLELLHRHAEPLGDWSNAALSTASILESLISLAEDALHWKALRQHYAPQRLVSLIDERMAQFEHNCAEIGMDLQYWGMIDPALHDDPEALAELAAAAREGRWQLTAIAQEVLRKWDKLKPQSAQMQSEIWHWVQGLSTRAQVH